MSSGDLFRSLALRHEKFVKFDFQYNSGKTWPSAVKSNRNIDFALFNLRQFNFFYSVEYNEPSVELK